MAEDGLGGRVARGDAERDQIRRGAHDGADAADARTDGEGPRERLHPYTESPLVLEIDQHVGERRRKWKRLEECRADRRDPEDEQACDREPILEGDLRRTNTKSGVVDHRGKERP